MNSIVEQFPPIINGLWQVADMERHGENLNPESVDVDISRYVEAGFHTFDMADHYGSSEIIMGQYQSRHPDTNLNLLTKWVPKPGDLSPAEISSAIQLSLDRLQSTSIDLLQYHPWNYADPCWLDHLFELNDLRNKGMIDHIGLTNTDAIHLKMAIESGIPIVSNQISFSLLDRRALRNMTQVCKDYGVKILAFGTLAGGYLTDKWLDKAEPNLDDNLTWSQKKYKRYIDQLGGWQLFQEVLSELNSLAQTLNLSIANLATGYILAQENVQSVIIGCRLGENNHLEENQIIAGNILSQSALTSIDRILSRFVELPGNCGDEYRKPPYLTAAGDLSDHLESMPSPYKLYYQDNEKQIIHSGTPWESLAGYCRAIKKGNRILISGTTATHHDRVIGGDSPDAQAHFVIDKIEGVLQTFGTSLESVLRTRIFIKRLDDWEPIARAHGARFGKFPPANTLVQANLIGDEYLVEIEAEAELF